MKWRHGLQLSLGRQAVALAQALHLHNTKWPHSKPGTQIVRNSSAQGLDEPQNAQIQTPDQEITVACCWANQDWSPWYSWSDLVKNWLERKIRDRKLYPAQWDPLTPTDSLDSCHLNQRQICPKLFNPMLQPTQEVHVVAQICHKRLNVGICRTD